MHQIRQDRQNDAESYVSPGFGYSNCNECRNIQSRLAGQNCPAIVCIKKV